MTVAPIPTQRQYVVMGGYSRTMQTLTQIQAAMRERLEHLQAAKDEYDLLEKALGALGGVSPEPAPRRRGRPPGAKSKPKPAAAAADA